LGEVTPDSGVGNENRDLGTVVVANPIKTRAYSVKSPPKRGWGGHPRNGGVEEEEANHNAFTIGTSKKRMSATQAAARRDSLGR
jgi:hypothetical protein